jgi:hypothetical protein
MRSKGRVAFLTYKNMKNAIIILFILIPNFSYGQEKSFLSKVYFFTEVTPPQLRWFDHKITKNSPHSYKRLIVPIGNWDEIYIGVGARINNKTTIEAGRYFLDYWDGVDVQNTSCAYGEGGSSGNTESANHYFLKFSYSIFKFNLFRKPLKFYCGLGYTYARRIGGNGADFAFTTVLPCRDSNDTLRSFVSTLEQSSNLAKDFHLLEGNIKFDYEFSKYMSFTTTLGFNQGFKVLGRSKYKYYATGEPTYYAESETKGNNIYWSLGLRLSPFANVEKRAKKKKSKTLKPQKRYNE